MEIRRNRTCRRYDRGETIFDAGDDPSGLFCINRGIVEVYRAGKEGRRQVVRLAREGDILGYRSLNSGEPHSTSAVSLEYAKICHLPKETFLGLISVHHDLSVWLLKLLSNDLRVAEDHIMEMAYKHVRARLAGTLLALKETHGRDNGEFTVHANLLRSDLATIASTTTESVSRFITQLRNERILEVRGQRIRILDHQALARIAESNDR
jgi:CRP/FNR family transcriptional regulator